MTKAQQSYENLNKAFLSLKNAVRTPPVEERDFGGIIQAFEYTYELTWKTLKVVLETNGISAPFPRVTFEEAFKRDMIEGNSIWKEIMESRNKTTHTYDQTLAKTLCVDIQNKYVDIFEKSIQKMKKFI